MPFLRLTLALLSLLVVLVPAGSARAHGSAVSRFVVSVGDGELAVRASLHLESVVTLIEGSPDSVHAGSGGAAATRHKQRILGYLHEHLKFRSGRTPCVPREPWGYGVSTGAMYVTVDLEYDCPKPTGALSVSSTLFEGGDEPHQIEGEFHAQGKRRIYQFTNVRSSVAIEPSSFNDRSNYRGLYVPPLGRASLPTETTTAAVPPPPVEAASTASRPMPHAHDAHDHDAHHHEPTRSLVGLRGILDHGGWYALALALVVVTWHVHRAIRKGRSQRSSRSRSAAS
ncbi:MAG TPA: hypothetical protein VM686_08005 [Polyangiaceae bacterium]|jgi:hypothetical protein|nr:hypothetical protein [Polyangiaceae bacterium]